MISKAKRKAPTNIYKISLLNEGVELINVPHIFHDPSRLGLSDCWEKNSRSYLLRALNIEKPIIFHGKKLNPL